MLDEMLVFFKLSVTALLVFLVMLVYANLREMRDPYSPAPFWEAAVGVGSATLAGLFGALALLFFIWGGI